MKITRTPTVVLATAATGVLLIAYAAGASTFGIPDGDSASLMQILVTGMKQLDALNDQLGTLRKTYSETKKLTGYAEDAVAAFQGLTRADLSGTVQILEDAVPNLRYFDREAHHLNTWTQGRGELTWMVRSCLRARQQEIQTQAKNERAKESWASNAQGGTYPKVEDGTAAAASVRADDVCGHLQQELSGARLAELIARDFGPPRTPAQVRLDQVAADALSDSDALYSRDRTLEDDWKSYEQYCFEAAKGSLTSDLDDSVMQRCQAAEVLVQIRSAREMQILRGEVTQLKDIEAYRLLNENAERKQEDSGRDREKQEILEGTQQMVSPDVRVTAPGFDVRGGQ